MESYQKQVPGKSLGGEVTEEVTVGGGYPRRVHRAPDGHAKEVTDTRSDNEVSSRSETRARTDVRGHIARVLLLQSMQIMRMQVGTLEQGQSKGIRGKEEQREERKGDMA